MKVLVVDASIVIKWVIAERDSETALRLRSMARFSAPELIIAELGNILQKKVARSEIQPDDVPLLATLLARAEVDFRPMRTLSPVAAQLAVRVGHPAYDCFYLALALSEGSQFVTADERFLRKLEGVGDPGLRAACLSLEEAARR